ncbi:PepSY domain-containing protein [Luteimonas sp. RIT-PG2_3]
MKPAFWARRAHKWIGLVIGLQALLWMVSGLYMTVISIDIIHGDHLAHVHANPLPADVARLDPARLQPGLQSYRLKRLLDREVYELRSADGIALVDAQTGERVGPLQTEQIRALAQAAYQGDAAITSIALLDKAPREVATRPVPLYRVDFADRGGTSLYFSPNSGELLARRHELWRWFDLMWMLHIMDYETRSDVNNTLFRVAASIALLFALSGIWLLFYSFGRRNPQ